MYSGVARSSYRQHSCDDVTKLGLCDWFTNELTDWRRRRRRRRRRRKEITYETLGLHLVQKYEKNVKTWRVVCVSSFSRGSPVSRQIHLFIY